MASTIPALSDPASGFDDRASPTERLRRRSRSAFLLVGALLLCVFGLAATLQIGGAVIGSGTIAVESRVKTIMHPTGGVLAAVLVHDGDRVKKGQELLRFDTSVSGVGASQANEGLDQLLARRARLEALREGASRIDFPPELTTRSDPAVQALILRERRLFALKRGEMSGSASLLGERIRQYREQIASYEAQIDAIRRQTVLIQPELAGVRSLYARKLVTVTRLNQLERTAVELDGQRSALEANVAEARARISEAQEQILNVAQTARADAGSELTQALTQLADQQVRSATASDTLSRSVVRAPQAGVVDKLAFTTTGSMVPSGQPLLQIVPDTDRLVIDARIKPEDVDQLRIGQTTRVSFSSLNRQVTPEVSGTLTFISAEPTEDTRTGQVYFRIRVELDNRKLVRDIKVQPFPGMPVEVFVQTGTRSILSFLTKPARDQFSHAMREE